jgi:hypothetical protein
VKHAAKRKQFGRSLSELELIKKKIAYLAAIAYAIEAATIETAALIDRGADDYMLETAILKVYSTEVLWQGVYETLQVYGGQGYFNDEPYERMMRDARINTIGEGANEVLKAFIALVGMREIGEGFKSALDRIKRPSTMISAAWGLARDHAALAVRSPKVQVGAPALHSLAEGLGKRVGRFGRAVERLLIHYREDVLERQYEQERIADAAIALYISSCTLARIDLALASGEVDILQRDSAELAIRMCFRSFDRALETLGDSDDALVTRLADAAVAKG